MIEGDWEGLVAELVDILTPHTFITDNIPHIEHEVEGFIRRLRAKVQKRNAQILEERIQKFHS